jgi:hydroxymethylpyrimidine pyrophosphatase-like HAD family hydrolase
VRATIALDLDQTLIYSAHGAGPLDGIATVWVEDFEDAPLSMMTVLAHQQLSELSTRHDVVPATTRTPEQFARVRLPGDLPYAICANGGVLLVQGVRDPEWDEQVARQRGTTADIQEVITELGRVAGREWVKTVRQVEDLFGYLVAHSREVVPAGWLEELTGWAERRGWTVSAQGRKVYVVPGWLTKGAAAAQLADRLGGPLLAAGDSVLDRSLLEAAVVAIRPAHGELERLGHRPARLHVTAVAGVGAAEEILTFLARHADDLTGGPGDDDALVGPVEAQVSPVPWSVGSRDV